MYLLQSSDCVSVDHAYYAHRTYPSVLVQEIQVSNPGDSTLMLTSQQIGAERWKAAHTVVQRLAVI